MALPSRAISALIAALLIAGTPALGSARGGSDTDPVAERVELLAEEAARLYEEKKYEQAVSRYLEAYKLTPTAAILYNVAYIYDKKVKDPAVAMQFYRRYVAAPDADPKVVERATTRLRELKDLLLKDRVTVPTPTPKPTPAKPTPGPVGPPAKAYADDPGLSRSTWGWIVAGSGAAVAGGGGILGLVASGTQEEFASSRDAATKEDLRSKGQTQALLADVMMGVGVAAVLTGVVLVLTDSSPEEISAGGVRIGISPGLSPGAPALVIGGRL